ncbi:MAG: hypothetical protein HZB76_04610 [Chlamydiae bacterium]|nr:hypothetical protein [Chlamydiota bacterium]
MTKVIREQLPIENLFWDKPIVKSGARFLLFCALAAIAAVGLFFAAISAAAIPFMAPLIALAIAGAVVIYQTQPEQPNTTLKKMSIEYPKDHSSIKYPEKIPKYIIPIYNLLYILTRADIGKDLGNLKEFTEETERNIDDLGRGDWTRKINGNTITLTNSGNVSEKTPNAETYEKNSRALEKFAGDRYDITLIKSLCTKAMRTSVFGISQGELSDDPKNPSIIQITKNDKNVDVKLTQFRLIKKLDGTVEKQLEITIEFSCNAMAYKTATDIKTSGFPTSNANISYEESPITD